jgi:hypothetical protein
VQVIWMNKKTISYLVIGGLLILALAAAGYIVMAGTDDSRETIKDTLVGTNLTYYSIAGRPLNYTIGQNDIVSIQPTTYEGKEAWKVRVGESLSWDLTMDVKGKEILYIDQLFRT